jgi:DNA repair exonuclease SbcCD nuclease subunit
MAGEKAEVGGAHGRTGERAEGGAVQGGGGERVAEAGARGVAGGRAEVVVGHSSDVHIPSLYYTPDDELGALRQVLATALAARVDVLLLAGDIFDHNRLPLALLDRTARLLADAALPVVILPGNHDPLTPDSVYRRGGLADPDNVTVLGVSVDQGAVLPELELEIWGHAHQDYGDMTPLRDPRPRSTRWQIAAAHGHFDPIPRDVGDFRGSWLIHPDEIAATGADYVALGHWNRPAEVGSNGVPAYYSGSPDFAGTINVVRFSASGVQVTREPLRIDPPA